MGSFDGLHLGHRQLIHRVLEAKGRGFLAAVLTFDPHPRRVLDPEKSLKRLFSLDDQVQVLTDLGVDEFIVEPFTHDLAKMTAEDFFLHHLHRYLHPAEITVGYDFRFGAGRSGDFETLKTLCETKKIKLEQVPVFLVNGEPVSSGRIRKHLENGNVKTASELLARPFYLTGTVVRGEGRGRQIGIPTLNLNLTSETFPKEGVYATWVRIGSRLKKFSSVTSIGRNPTFVDESKAPLKIETHVLDFSEQVYGENVVLYFVDKIRDQKKFSGREELIRQIHLDIEATKALL